MCIAVKVKVDHSENGNTHDFKSAVNRQEHSFMQLKIGHLHLLVNRQEIYIVARIQSERVGDEKCFNAFVCSLIKISGWSGGWTI